MKQSLGKYSKHIPTEFAQNVKKFVQELSIYQNELAEYKQDVIVWRNVTSDEQVEEKIKSIAKFPEENPYPVLRISQNGTILYANPSTVSLLQDWNCTIGQSAPGFLCQIIADTFHMKAIKKDIEINHRDRIFSFTIVPVADTSYVNLYGVDITERKQLEKELWDINESLERHVSERTEELLRVNETLQKSESSLANAQRIAHIGNWEWNIVKNELRWSDEIYRIFGLMPQEFGATYEAFLNSVHPEDREFVKESVNNALYKKMPYSIDHRIILPNNTERIVHEEAEVIFDNNGKAIQMNGTVQDITERKLSEEALCMSEKKYRLLLENLPQLIFYKDKNSVYISCNENVARFFHIKPEEITGKTDYDFFPRELAEKYRADDKSVIESEQILNTEEKHFKDGQESIVHTVSTTRIAGGLISPIRALLQVSLKGLLTTLT